jgi:hypothetical protein
MNYIVGVALTKGSQTQGESDLSKKLSNVNWPQLLFWLFVILLLTIGILCIFTPFESLNTWLSENKHWREALTALGHALVIAAVLAGSVDLYA